MPRKRALGVVDDASSSSADPRRDVVACISNAAFNNSSTKKALSKSKIRAFPPSAKLWSSMLGEYSEENAADKPIYDVIPDLHDIVLPPKYVFLPDLWLYLVMKLTTTRERKENWPQNFDSNGSIRKDTPPVDPPAIVEAHGLCFFPVAYSGRVLCGHSAGLNNGFNLVIGKLKIGDHYFAVGEVVVGARYLRMFTDYRKLLSWDGNYDINIGDEVGAGGLACDSFLGDPRAGCLIFDDQPIAGRLGHLNGFHPLCSSGSRSVFRKANMPKDYDYDAAIHRHYERQTNPAFTITDAVSNPLGDLTEYTTEDNDSTAVYGQHVSTAQQAVPASEPAQLVSAQPAEAVRSKGLLQLPSDDPQDYPALQVDTETQNRVNILSEMLGDFQSIYTEIARLSQVGQQIAAAEAFFAHPDLQQLQTSLAHRKPRFEAARAAIEDQINSLPLPKVQTLLHAIFDNSTGVKRPHSPDESVRSPRPYNESSPEAAHEPCPAAPVDQHDAAQAQQAETQASPEARPPTPVAVVLSQDEDEMHEMIRRLKVEYVDIQESIKAVRVRRDSHSTRAMSEELAELDLRLQNVNARMDQVNEHIEVLQRQAEPAQASLGAGSPTVVADSQPTIVAEPIADEMIIELTENQPQ